MTNIEKAPKTEGVQKLIEEAWKLGKVVVNSTKHSKDRSEERDILDTDLREVIFYGDREDDQDRWEDSRKHWKYALRNKSVDERDIRVIFDIEKHPDVIVVTVMHVIPEKLK